jgi:DNA-binding NarL/FixJ family response regulator
VCSPGLPPHALVVLRAMPSDVERRAPLLGARWALTPRQREVLEMLARGASNREIAARIRCAERTVELHVTALLRKSGCDSRARLVAEFWTSG